MEMKIAAARALAALAREDVPDEVAAAYGSRPKFGPDYIIPVTTMTVLSILLVVLVKVIFKGNTRDLMTAVWTGFVCVFLVLTLVGTSMRGPGMDMYAPWALPSTHQCFAP